ncbi:MAG: polysaccharide biosynthesis tyrosine autokinase [Candidatus Aminicenantes bacterium]|nr:polysaccharide biosynthesis tyrosine autokinase [Candidatus Aminicenantes bacterium]
MEYEEKERHIDLSEYWQRIVKRKWVIISLTTVIVLIVGVFSFTSTPLYRARTTVLIKETSSRMLSIQEMFSNYPVQRYDFMNQNLNTQLKILTSRSLAERVARKMNLSARPEIQALGKSKTNPIQAFKNFFSFRWLFGAFAPQKKKEDMDSQPILRQDPDTLLAPIILGGISVSPIRDTRVVELSYTSSHPVLAADIVNALAEEFISYSVEIRYEATQEASEFLNEQIAQLREELASKESELQRYGQEKELYFLSDRESTVLNKFSDLNTAFTQAQIERINAESAYRELKSLNIASLPQFVNNALIQNLKTQYTNIKNEYEEKSKIFKPNYPEMITLKAKLDSMRDELKSEIEKAVGAAETEYRSTLKKQWSLKSLLDSQRKDVARMNSNAILYNSLKIEVENKRMLLNSLVAKQNETLVSARLGGLRTSDIKILDKALVPRAPFSPNTKRNILLALFFGLFMGIGLAFGLEYLDNSVKGPEDVEKLVGLPSLGVIPYLSPDGTGERRRYGYSRSRNSYSDGKEASVLNKAKGIELINKLYPQFYISEDYRTVRTSIMLSSASNPPQAITFSSSLPQEGKTATVANLAVAFAQLKKDVLVLDADLRKPRLHRIFKIGNHKGLSSYLTGRSSFKEVVQKTTVDNVWLIPSGPLPPNPAELLDSEPMKELIEEAKSRWDFVLIDTPPVLAVIDPVITSSLSDGTVFVVKAGETSRKPFLKAVEEFEKAKSRIIGVLFNEIKIKKEGYHSSYYRHYYRQQYYGDDQGQD